MAGQRTRLPLTAAGQNETCAGRCGSNRVGPADNVSLHSEIAISPVRAAVASTTSVRLLAGLQLADLELALQNALGPIRLRYTACALRRIGGHRKREVEDLL